MQALLAVAVAAHGRLHDADEPFPALAQGHGLPATDLVRVASGLLASGGLEPFELALWNTFGGLPPTPNASRGAG